MLLFALQNLTEPGVEVPPEVVTETPKRFAGGARGGGPDAQVSMPEFMRRFGPNLAQAARAQETLALVMGRKKQKRRRDEEALLLCAIDPG